MAPQVAEYASIAESQRSFVILCPVPVGTAAARLGKQNRRNPDTGK
jgi:hypothetical protein